VGQRVPRYSLLNSPWSRRCCFDVARSDCGPSFQKTDFPSDLIIGTAVYRDILLFIILCDAFHNFTRQYAFDLKYNNEKNTHFNIMNTWLKRIFYFKMGFFRLRIKRANTTSEEY